MQHQCLPYPGILVAASSAFYLQRRVITTLLAETIKDMELQNTTEFVIRDAMELLPKYKNVDFFVIGCRLIEDYKGLFSVLNVNPHRGVVVANNLFDRNATNAYSRTFKGNPYAKYVTLPIGKGIKVTRIGTGSTHNNQYSS